MSTSASITFHTSKLSSSDFINLVRNLISYGWSVDDFGEITYMADDFDWYSCKLSELDTAFNKIAMEIDNSRASGISLLWKNSQIGGAFLWMNAEEILFSLSINPLKLRESNVVDFSWYMEKLLPVLAGIYVPKISCDHIFQIAFPQMLYPYDQLPDGSFNYTYGKLQKPQIMIADGKQLATSDLMDKEFDLLDNGFKGQEREEVIKDMLENYVVPFLLLISTGEGIKKAARKYKTLKNKIDVETREALSI